MARLSSLFERFKSLCGKQAEIAAELRAVEREILAIDCTKAPAPKPAPRAAAKSKLRPSKGQLSPVTRAMAMKTLAAIREVDAGQPVLRREISKQLGIGDYACAYRLKRLQAIGFVERVGGTHYRVAKEVPDL